MLPARKSFAVELRSAESATNATGVANLTTWTVLVKGNRVHLSIVWLQGVIVMVRFDHHGSNYPVVKHSWQNQCYFYGHSMYAHFH